MRERERGKGGAEISIDLSVFYFSRVDRSYSFPLCPSVLLNDEVALDFEVVVVVSKKTKTPLPPTERQCNG